MSKPLKTVEEILEKYFTGEQYDEMHGTFIRIPFTKQMNKAKHELNAYYLELFEGMIGEDEPDKLIERLDNGDRIVEVNPKNILRAELKQQLSKELGGQSEQEQ